MSYHEEALLSLGLSLEPEANEYRGPYQRELPDLLWARLQPHLRSHGYMLRPRFHPQWQPSWIQTKFWIPWKRNPKSCKDHVAVPFSHWTVIDAMDMTEGRKVVLKVVKPDEARILRYLSADIRRADPRNPCVPVIDILPVPETTAFEIAVMPFLRFFEHPDFHCLDEIIQAFRQILEGIEFLHEHNIAHRNIDHLKILMDAPKLVRSSCHYFPWQTEFPKFKGRKKSQRCRFTVPPIRYYLVDFGGSRWFTPEEKKKLKQDVGEATITREISEAFKLDITQLGVVLFRVTADYDRLHLFSQLAFRMINTERAECLQTAGEALEELGTLVLDTEEAIFTAKIQNTIKFRVSNFL